MSDDVTPEQVAGAAVRGLRKAREARAEVPATKDDRRETAELVVKSCGAGLGVAKTILSHIAGDSLAEPVAIEMMKQTLRDVAPTSMVERMLAEQMVVLHAQVLDLNRMAKRAESYDAKATVIGMAAKMQGEFRRTVGALKEWRAPTRQFIVAQQANVAHQQVVNQTSEKNPPMTNELGSKDA